MMVTGAIVYDWLYALLTPEEKQAFIQELIRLAKTQECAYPPPRQGSVTGHASEAQIMGDMLSAGIAIYDEAPQMYDLAAGRFFREHRPVRNWLYNGRAYHQGDSYAGNRSDIRHPGTRPPAGRERMVAARPLHRKQPWTSPRRPLQQMANGQIANGQIPNRKS